MENGMNYLVTGGAGFIGAAIAKKLVERGDKITIIDNLSTGYRENIPDNAVFIEGNAGNIETIERLNEQRFDAILHFAGQSSGEISFEDPIYDLNSNAASTLLLLNFAVRTGCRRFIYASTMSVYGEQSGKEKFSESDIANPKSMYAVGKLASENYLKIYQKQYGVDYTALRLFNVYGPGQNLENLKQGMISIYLKQFLDSRFDKVIVKGALDRFRDLIYIDDVVNITLYSLHDDGFSNLIINVGTGCKTTVKEMIEMIKERLGSSKEVVVSGGTIGDQFGIYSEISMLKELYENDLINFKDGLVRTVNFLMDEG